MRKVLTPIVIIPALLGLALAFSVFVKIRGEQKFEASLKQAAERSVSIGPLPKGKLIHLEDSTDYHGSVQAGRVLLVFLTTDCGACNKEVRNVSQALPRVPSHLTIYAVFFESRDKVLKFTQEHPIGVPVLLDKGGQIFSSLRIKHFPAKILMENGTIVRTWVGSSPNEDSLLKEIG